MNQLCKQVATVTGHDCALKRLESAALAAQVAEHIANGGKVIVVSGYVPKARPVSRMTENIKRQINQERINRENVLKAVASGHSIATDIRLAVGISHAATARHLNRLLLSGKVRMVRQGNKHIWSLRVAA